MDHKPAGRDDCTGSNTKGTMVTMFRSLTRNVTQILVTLWHKQPCSTQSYILEFSMPDFSHNSHLTISGETDLRMRLS